MPDELQQRNIRAQKEDFIRDLVISEGKIKGKDLYGLFTKKYQGVSVRTFFNEYLVALDFRKDIMRVNTATGYWIYDPSVYEKEIAGKENGKNQ